jgi:hypothetical protein
VTQLCEATGELGLKVAGEHPSFVDELVKAVLVDRHGDRLIIKGAPGRTAALARRAAETRGATDRLEIG